MQLRLGSRTLDLNTPIVMGVLNVTPDSFSDGGKYRTVDDAIRQALHMFESGASIVDVGGESSRPGAERISENEEIDRVIPVIEGIAGGTEQVISIDTSKPGVMRAAVQAGASLINDVYALRQEGAVDAAVKLDAAVCLMHMLGEPGTMQDNPRYQDLAGDILGFLSQRISVCREAGITADSIAIDPGFGFGKTHEHNVNLLAGLEKFRELEMPLVVGLSRKRTLGALTGKDVDERLPAGIAAAVLAVERGANIVRTHDVDETVDALKIVNAVLRPGIDE